MPAAVVDFEWIPREKNKDADALSNDAMDGKSVHRVLTDESADGSGSEAESDSTVTPADSACASPRARVRPLRLLLVQAPLDSHATPRIVAAVRRLVDPRPSSAPMTP